jgi:pimeloyl-ACP methyl ester carboxylesterase
VRKRSLRIAIVAAVIALVVPLAGCVSFLPPVVKSTPTGEHVSADLTTFYHQVLTWKTCADNMQCTTAKAPLDWTNPAAGSIKLALIRQVAKDGHPLGSLLVNPGGPGGSGYDYIRDGIDQAVDSQLQDKYDIVGFDPRGVNHSSAVDCYTNPKTLDHFIYGIVPGVRGSDEWITAQENLNKQFGQECSAETGALLGKVDTVSAAHDLDLLRAVLGDTKLNYLGYSYGTLLGQTYANLYPQNTGRLVFDGVVDPTVTPYEMSETQAKGFEKSLRKFLSGCPSIKGCPFTRNVTKSMKTVRALLDSLDESPLRNKDGRELGASTMFTAIIYPLYSSSNGELEVKLFSTVMKGDPSFAFTLADAYNDRTANGTYADNSTEAFTAINCLDYPSDPTVATMRAEAVKLNQVAPVFGRLMAYGGTSCFDWPYPPTRTAGALAAAGSAPILIVDTTGDPATPYAWGVHVSKLLQNGHLVTYHGYGHTAYNKSNQCVNDAVDKYFIKGTVPKSDPQC